MKQIHDWDKIKTEYVTGDMSYAELAEKYGMTKNFLSNYASKHKWYDERKKYRTRIVNKTIKKKEAEEVKQMTKLKGITCNLTGMVNEVSKRSDQLYKHIVTERNELGAEHQEVRELDKVDTKMLRDLTAVTKDLVSIMRNLYGIPTLQEEQQLALAREKLEIDKAKAAAYMPDDDDDETGVIMLAPIKEEEDG